MRKTEWQDPLMIQNIQRPRELWPYLLEQQSLTQRIRKTYPSLYIQCLNQYDTDINQADAAIRQLTSQQRAMIREVYLRTNNKIGVYGHSTIPYETRNALSWLETLGEQSLGDVLNQRGKWQRNNLRVSLLTADNREYQQAVQCYTTTETHLWARQSELIIQGHAILMTEVFFSNFFISS